MKSRQEPIKSIKIKVPRTTSIKEAEDAARAAIKATGELSLIAWYDSQHKTGGPIEACGGESSRCVEDYASSHGAVFRVKVKGIDHEFYFAPVPENVTSLDREAVLASHEDLARDSFENFQGG